MITIKFFSTTGNEIFTHEYNGDSIEEAYEFVHTQLDSGTVEAESNRGSVKTTFKSEFIGGYQIVVREKVKPVARPF